MLLFCKIFDKCTLSISLCFRKKKLYTCALGLQGAEVGGKGEDDEKGCEGEG